MKTKLTLLLVALSLPSCGSTVCIEHADGTQTCKDADEESLEDKTCEEVNAFVFERAKEIFASCGISDQVGEAPIGVCDEATKQTLICYNDCFDLLTCGAVTGEDIDAFTAYADCVLPCGTT
jgi:hypothetical protein